MNAPQQQVQHCQDDIEQGRVHSDGQLGANIVEDVVLKPETVMFWQHGLGRPVKQYTVVWSDKPIRFPAVARDAEGNYLNDADRIGLIFAESRFTARMRFA